MAHKCHLTISEKSFITSVLEKGKSPLEISKIRLEIIIKLWKIFVAILMKVCKGVDKGYLRIVSQNSLSWIKCVAVKNSGLTSEELFRCIGETIETRTTWCHLLKKVGTSVKSITMPPLTKIHVQKHLKWAEGNMKVDFSKVLFMDESCDSLNGPDDWSKRLVVNRWDCYKHLRCQQEGGGILICAGIIGDIILGLWNVPDSIKMIADAYIAFFREHLQP